MLAYFVYTIEFKLVRRPPRLPLLQSSPFRRLMHSTPAFPGYPKQLLVTTVIRYRGCAHPLSHSLSRLVAPRATEPVSPPPLNTVVVVGSGRPNPCCLIHWMRDATLFRSLPFAARSVAEARLRWTAALPIIAHGHAHAHVR